MAPNKTFFNPNSVDSCGDSLPIGTFTCAFYQNKVRKKCPSEGIMCTRLYKGCRAICAF